MRKLNRIISRRAIFLTCFLTIAFGTVSLIFTNVVSASLASVNTATLPNTEIRISVSRDGSEPFSTADPLDDGAGAHTPGLDLNANNNVVRSFDSIEYRLDWNVNEVDATNVLLVTTLPDTGTNGTALDLKWVVDPDFPLPAGCLTTGVTPASSISADGRTLTCNVGDKAEGTSGTIFPIAELGAGRMNDDVILLNASVDSDQTDPVDSEDVSTTISTAPTGNWLKGYDPAADPGPRTPDEYTKIYRNGEEGRVFIWPVYFKLGEETARGAEPLDDSATITFYDHFWSAPANAIFLTDLEVSNTAVYTNYASEVGRAGCGGYDGNDSLPYGRAGLGNATNTDSGVTLGTQSFACSLDAGLSATNGYPTVEITVSGIDTDAIAAKTTKGGDNAGVVVTGQIGFWVSEADLRQFADPNPGTAGSGDVDNAISASSTAIATVPDDISPIQVYGTTSTVNEITTDDNYSVTAFAWNQSQPGGNQYNHMVKFFPGPYSERFISLDDGTEIISNDSRNTARGGNGEYFEVNDAPLYWNGLDVVPRGRSLTIMAGLTTASEEDASTAVNTPAHLCVGIDTRDISLVSLPSSFTRSEVRVTGNSSTQSTTQSTQTGSPSDGIAAHLLIGSTGGGEKYRRGSGFQNGLWAWTYDPPAYKIEFGFNPTYQGHIASGQLEAFELTCNNDDSNIAWTAASAVTDPSLYNTVRVVILEERSWTSRYDSMPSFIRPNGTENKYGDEDDGYGYYLALQAEVGTDVNQNASGDEIFVNVSRARGVWDTTVDNAPPNLTCTDGDAFNGTDYATSPPDGWCGLGYDQNADASGFDNEALVEDLAGNGAFGDADKLTIVDARPSIVKTNQAGLTDIVNNGDIVTFDINFGITGSSQETLSNVLITDTLASHWEFISMTQPSTTVEEAAQPPDGNTVPLTTPVCNFDSVANEIVCEFGRQAGGWSDSISVTFRVTGGEANAALPNSANMGALDAFGTTPINIATSTGFAYMPGSQHELIVRKEVPDLDGVCIREPGLSALASDDCSLVDLDGNLVYTLHYTNTGNVTLENLTLIDVLPFNGDATEPQTTFYGNGGTPTAGAGSVGDGRVAPSAFSGTTSLTSVVDNFGSAVQTTLSGTVDRNPETNTSTWAAGISAGATAYRIDVPSLSPGQTGVVTVTIATNGNVTDDIYTNNFGMLAGGEPAGRMAAGDNGILVTNRSNDVSIMVRDADLGAISGNVTEDTDTDGVGDTPIAGVVMELLDSAGNPVLDANGNPITTTTDANGDFLFSDVPPGDYTVIEQQPAGYTDVSEVEGGDDGDHPDNGVTNSIAVTVDPGETDTGNDFVEEIPGSISGNVTEDTTGDGVGDTPIAGVVMELLDDTGNPVLDANGNPITTTTDANGNYSFPDVPPGEYLVAEQQPAGYQDVSEVDGGADGDHPDNGITNLIPVTVDPGEEDAGNDFVEELIPGAISGNVTEDTTGDGVGDTPIAGVVIELLDSVGNPVLDANGNPITTTTDANGDYSFPDVTPGDYTVIEQQPAGYQDVSEAEGGDDGDNPDNGVTNSIDVTVDPGETDTGNDFVEEQNGAITGNVSADTDGDMVIDTPLANVVLELLDSNGNPVLDANGSPITTTTDANGDYEFLDVPAGDYQIAEQQPSGYNDQSEIDGGDDGDNPDNGILNNIPVTVDPGETDTGNDFIEELEPTAVLVNSYGTDSRPVQTIVLLLGFVMLVVLSRIIALKRD